MNMYARGMSPYMLNHFLRVARNMNSYVAASAQQYYRQTPYPSYRDQATYWPAPTGSSISSYGIGGLIVYGLDWIGRSTGMVYMGYRLGQYMNRIF